MKALNIEQNIKGWMALLKLRLNRNMKASAFKAFMSLFLMAMMLATTGCPSKKDKSQVTNRNRNEGWQQNYGPDGQPYISGGGNGSEWGTITTSGDFTNILYDFLQLGNDGDLGYVSGAASSDTGVRMRGQINLQQCSGSVGILIWDDYANQGADPYYLQLQVVNCQGYVITAADSFGSVTFSGGSSSNYWSGTVTYKNRDESNSSSRTLGRFNIYSGSVFY